MKKNILILIVVIIIIGSICVYAEVSYQASQIYYKDTTLDHALDDLYTTVNSGTFGNLKYVGMYSNGSDINNYSNISVTVSNLVVGKQYSMIVGRSVTGGSTAQYEGYPTVTVSDASYSKIDNYLYSFVPSSSSVTVTIGTVSFGSNCRGRIYAFVFEGLIQ